MIVIRQLLSFFSSSFLLYFQKNNVALKKTRYSINS